MKDKEGSRDAHSDEREVVPHLLEEVVEVPFVVGGDGHAMRHLLDDVQLLAREHQGDASTNEKRASYRAGGRGGGVSEQSMQGCYLNGNLINLVEDIDGRDVHAVALDNVNQIVFGGVIAQADVGIVDAILSYTDQSAA